MMVILKFNILGVKTQLKVTVLREFFAFFYSMNTTHLGPE